MDNQKQKPPYTHSDNVKPQNFNQQQNPSCRIFPLNSQPDTNTKDTISLSVLFRTISQPVLYFIAEENIILYNKAFENFYPQTGNENITIEQTIERLWETENMPAVINDLLSNCNCNEINKINRTVRISKYKIYYWLYATIGKNNQRLAWLIFDKNIDDTEKTGQEKKIDASSQMLDIFFSNLSHEIRTPLNAILGFAELISISDLSEEQRKHYLDIIRNKGRLLIHYLEDVMELTKLESQNIQLNITETDLPRLLNEIHKEFLDEINQRKLSIELFLKILPTSEINICYTDKGRLYQVIKLLIDIALILTDKGYIQLGYELKDSKQINYFVKYTGKALTADQQKILTNPLRIKEEISDPVIQQIGLKLALIKLITHCMEGRFSTEPFEQGNIFNVCLPYKRKEPRTDQSTQPMEKPNWKNRVILIAEDDDVNFQFLEALLADTHAQIIHVLNGKEAVEICQSLPKVDLILMDLKMPEKNGYEAIKEIRQLKGAEIPIIAQTAYASKDEKEKCFRMGCDAYLTKPIDVEAFFKVLNKFLNE
jgi:CheY-like chemotaxis protein/signal transduction histidine kinase